MVGAIGLYGLCADGEAGAQIYAAGATKSQAGILFNDAVNMVNQSPTLMKKLHQAGGEGNVYRLAYKRERAFFEPVSRETKKTGSGPRPHMALCDEVHEHPDGGVIEILERGFKFREQPLLLMITNSGSDRKSICWAERQHAVNVAHGTTTDDTSFSYVCALDDDDDPFEDPECWIKVNPLLGVTITRDYLAKQVKQARDIPAKANGVRRLHFCQWTDAENAWISWKIWTGLEDKSLKLSDFEGRKCWAGLDLSSKNDLTAKVLLFDDGLNDAGEQKFAAFAHAWTPKETLLARAERDGAPYDEWVEKGWLTAQPGRRIRLSGVAADFVKDADRFDLQLVAYDQYLIDDFKMELEDIGANLPLVSHPQDHGKRWQKKEDKPFLDADGYLWMPGSIDELEGLIVEGRLRVEINPSMQTAVLGAVFQENPSGLRRLSKGLAHTRIDVAVALAMAVGAATMISQGEAEQSYLDHESLVVL